MTMKTTPAMPEDHFLSLPHRSAKPVRRLGLQEPHPPAPPSPRACGFLGALAVKAICAGGSSVGTARGGCSCAGRTAADPRAPLRTRFWGPRGCGRAGRFGPAWVGVGAGLGCVHSGCSAQGRCSVLSRVVAYSYLLGTLYVCIHIRQHNCLGRQNDCMYTWICKLGDTTYECRYPSPLHIHKPSPFQLPASR